MLALAYDIQLHAIRKGEGFDPQSGSVIRQDRGLKRWGRGFTRGRWWLNIFHVLYSIGAWATAGLGLYAAIKGMYELAGGRPRHFASGFYQVLRLKSSLTDRFIGMIAAFEIPQVNSFTCTSPLNLNA